MYNFVYVFFKLDILLYKYFIVRKVDELTCSIQPPSMRQSPCINEGRYENKTIQRLRNNHSNVVFCLLNNNKIICT